MAKTAREIAEAGIRAAEHIIVQQPDEKSVAAAMELLELGVDGIEARLLNRTD